MGEMKRQQQSRIAEPDFNESWSYYRNELWYLIMLHDVQQRKVHNSWLWMWLGTVCDHLQYANWSWPYKPSVPWPRSFPAKPARSAALARSRRAGNSVFHVLKHKYVISGKNWTVAVGDSRNCLLPAFLCGVWYCQVCYLSWGRLRWSVFSAAFGLIGAFGESC